jgi:O-antigen/teichoic acid export membrane protein
MELSANKIDARIAAESEVQSTAAELYAPASTRKNFGWILAGNIVAELSLFGVLMGLAKLGSAEIQGRFLLSLAIATPVAMFSSLGLSALFVTDSQERFSFYDYFYLRIAFCVLSVIICLSIGSYLVLRGSYDANFLVVLGLIGCFKAVDFVSDICYAVFQKKQRMKYTGISRALKAAGALTATMAILYATGKLAAALLGWLAAYSAMMFWYDIKIARRFYPLPVEFSLSRSLTISKQAMPLVAGAFLMTLNGNISRYVIAAYCGEADVGYFGSISYGGVAISMIFVAMGSALLPKMVDYFKTHPLYIWRVAAKAAMVAVGLGLLAFMVSLLAGRFALRVFFSAEHAAHVKVLWILMGGSAIVGLASVMGFAGTACRAFTPSIFTWAIVGCITLLGCIILVPKYGLVGAAIATIMSNIAAFVLTTTIVAIYTWRRHRQIALSGPK